MTIHEIMAIAITAHRGQTYGSKSYFDGHLVPVMEKVAERKDAEYGMLDVALLHDVLEDTRMTEEDLAELGVSSTVIKSVKILTRNKGITYFDYIRSVKASCNDWAIAVKIADLETNLVGASDSLKARYIKALEILRG